MIINWDLNYIHVFLPIYRYRSSTTLQYIEVISAKCLSIISYGDMDVYTDQRWTSFITFLDLKLTI